MVILGLGSNVGDRLAHLRKGFKALRQIAGIKVKQVSPSYVSNALLPENAPPEWDMPHLNLAIRCETTLTPDALLPLLKKIEWSVGRKPEVRHWGPRILDIDILAWNDEVIQTDALTVPHANLQERPFALWPLADVAPLWMFPLKGPNFGKTAAQIAEKWGSRFTGEAPLATRQINQRIDTPELVGIINITPDSFSDGGNCFNEEQAWHHAQHLINAGAEILDIGAESTAPTATPITPAEEWQRLESLLTIFKKAKADFVIQPKLSLDTRHAEVAAKAILLGMDWINDVSGLDDPAMRDLIKSTQKECIVMHHLSIPERRDNVLPRTEDPVQAVYDWAHARINLLEAEGIARENIIFDPGIGFGKMAEQSLLILRQVHRFTALNTRLLIGHSRKTFLSLFSGSPFHERDVETAAISLCLADQGIDYLRVHNVEMTARVLKIFGSIKDYQSVH